MALQRRNSGACLDHLDTDEIEARFPPGRVRDLEGIGSGDQLLAVASQFDYDYVVWFFGVGEASVPGN